MPPIKNVNSPLGPQNIDKYMAILRKECIGVMPYIVMVEITASACEHLANLERVRAVVRCLASSSSASTSAPRRTSFSTSCALPEKAAAMRRVVPPSDTAHGSASSSPFPTRAAAKALRSSPSGMLFDARRASAFPPLDVAARRTLQRPACCARVQCARCAAIRILDIQPGSCIDEGPDELRISLSAAVQGRSPCMILRIQGAPLSMRALVTSKTLGDVAREEVFRRHLPCRRATSDEGNEAVEHCTLGSLMDKRPSKKHPPLSTRSSATPSNHATQRAPAEASSST